MILLAVETATALFLGGLALIVAVLLRRGMGKPARRRFDSGNSGTPFSSMGTRHEMPQDVLRWEVHMHEVARDLQGTLDSKIAILNQLVIDADRRIALLGKLEAQGAPRPVKPASAVPGGSAEESRIVTLGEDEIYRLADAGFGGAAIADLTQSPLGDIEMILSLRSTR